MRKNTLYVNLGKLPPKNEFRTLGGWGSKVLNLLVKTSFNVNMSYLDILSILVDSHLCIRNENLGDFVLVGLLNCTVLKCLNNSLQMGQL